MNLPPGVTVQPSTDAQRKHRLEMTEKMLGTPFKQLPGKPDQHKVLAEIGEHKIRVSHVEMVMNDAWMIDVCDGAGAYDASLDNPMQIRLYILAVQLYGCQPIDLHDGRLGPYSEVVN